MTPDVVVLSAARTPIGRFLGGLAAVDPVELGRVAGEAALARAGVAPEAIEGLTLGTVLPSSEGFPYVARHLALRLGLPEAAPALRVDRACASGLEAIAACARAIRLGEAELLLAAGVENMSMMPHALRGARAGWRLGGAQVQDMLLTALHDAEAGCSIGETVERLARSLGITRAEADEAALRSQARAEAARALHEAQITPVTRAGRRGDEALSRDEAPRPDARAEDLARLPGLYARDGVVTAGNSAGLNDGGAAMVLASAARARALGLAPLGRVLSWAEAGVAPLDMALGPVEASRRALARAGLGLDQIEHIELSDSFTAQAIAAARAMGLDPAALNPLGGASALGHPMGATGLRLVHTALMGLRERGGGRALCTLCVGGGQGAAMVLAVE